VLSAQSPVEHSQRVASYNTSLVVSGGVTVLIAEEDEIFMTRNLNVTQ